MFAVIYQGYVKDEFEAKYQGFWNIVATYFVKECGALGSTLHKTEEGMWLAYSKWPNKATRDAAWPALGKDLSPALPLRIQEAVNGLKQCLEAEKQLPELCMEIIEEIS